jgi:hypothetical protein
VREVTSKVLRFRLWDNGFGHGAARLHYGLAVLAPGRNRVGGVAFTPTCGGDDASTLLPLLQPAVISATARPMTAAWRYAFVLTSLLSRFRTVWVKLRLPLRWSNRNTREANMQTYR